MDEFLKKLRSGDGAAYEELVNKYNQKIFSLAFSLVSDREDALDITQDVFIKIYNSIASFSEKSSLSTWIYTVTKNTCYDYLRKRQRTTTEEIPDDLASDIEITPEAMLEKLENKRLVRECINKIPLKYKTPLILKEFQNLSYKEIAEICDVSEGTVKSRIYRAKDYLLKLISENWEQN